MVDDIVIPYHVKLLKFERHCVVTWGINESKSFDNWETAYDFAVNKLKELAEVS
jgi:hypothetical protein